MFTFRERFVKNLKKNKNSTVDFINKNVNLHRYPLKSNQTFKIEILKSKIKIFQIAIAFNYFVKEEKFSRTLKNPTT